MTDFNRSLFSDEFNIGKIERKSDSLINVKDFGAKSNGSIDASSSIQLAIDSVVGSGEIVFPSGVYLLNNNISVTNKSLNLLAVGKVEFIGAGGFVFDSTLGTTYSADNVFDGDNFIKNSSIPVSVGDYVEISGAIQHSDYTPSRYVFTKVIAKVSKVDSSIITLDRQIKFNLSKYPNWQTGTVYIIGQRVNSNGNVYECKSGTGFSVQSGNTAPTGLGSSISDGVITWSYFGTYTPNVTVAKILNPYNLNISKGFIFNGTNGGTLSITHCVGGSINAISTGSRSSSGSGVAISQSCDFEVDFIATDLKSTFGLLMNDCNNFYVKNKSTRVGTPDNVATKTFRGNGLQQGTIISHYNTSMYSDSVIYGSRDLKVDVNSIGAGQKFRDATNWSSGVAYKINDIVKNGSNMYICTVAGTSSIAPTGTSSSIIDGILVWSYLAAIANRLEAVQFSEINDADITAYIINANDQALEVLSGINITINAKRLSTEDGSTEGAMVIKQNSKNVTILNPVIRCYNGYGIKVECLYQANDIKIINPDIVNYRGVGIQVRDYTGITPYNVGVRIIGGHISAPAPISVYVNHNDVSVKGTTVESKEYFAENPISHAIQGNADYLRVEGVNALGCNDIVIRAVVSAGENDKITGVTSDGAIYVRDQSRFKFSLNRFQYNKVPRIYIDQDAFSFYIDKGVFKVSAVPTLYAIENGTVLYQQFFTAGSSLGWACINGGAKYLAWTTGVSYTVGQRVNNSGNVYECKTAGVSGATAPTGTGINISDGVCVWDYVSAYVPYVLSAFGEVNETKKGIAVIANNTNNITVTHGLSAAPNYIFLQNRSGFELVRPVTVTSTTFDITSSTTVSPAATIHWRASV